MRRYAVTLTAFALLTSACGQYAGVHDRRFEGGRIPAGETGITSSTETDSGATGSGSTGATTGTGDSPTGGAVDPSGGTGTPSGATGTGGGSAAEAGLTAPATTTGTTTGTVGVTPTTIKIGLHAPLTGATPLKAESFNRGKDMYWQKGNNGKPVEIFGRQVEVVFQDDQYNPSHARAVCAQMAEQQGVAILVGGGGTDQIQACAAYAGSKAIPYLSVGTTEVGLTRLPNYFAVSMSYADQVPLLVQYMKASQGSLGWNGDAARVAAVITNSPNFDDAATVFAQSIPGATMLRPEKNERGASMAGRLCTGTLKNFDVVFPLIAPTYFLEMAGSSKCNPQYVGVGISMGLDQVAGVGCQTGGMANARFFSPAPAFVDSNKYDPLFRQAGGQDDIEWLLWGLWRSIHQLLVQAGPNLTREGFIQAASTATIKRAVFPDAAYSPTNHFGAKQVSLLRADCNSRQYVTEAAFKSSF